MLTKWSLEFFWLIMGNDSKVW